MAIRTKPVFGDLLSVKTRAELRAAVSGISTTLTLPQVQRLASYAELAEPALQSLRLGIIHTYTSDLLDPWLNMAAALHGIKLETYHAPFGVTVQEAQKSSGLVRHAPDMTLLLMRKEDLHPALAKPLAGLGPTDQEMLRKQVLERLSDIVGQFRAYEVGQIVLTLLPAMRPPGLGLYDAQSELSESVWWSRLKADISMVLRESIQASLFLDLDDVLQ